jgi:ribonuclease-3
VTSLSDYQFCNAALKDLALTHRSARKTNNERLEFLGDAILGHVIAEYLYREFPDADEGQLTRTRASLVNKETLAKVARDMELGEQIVLGEGELKSGGWRRDSILANTLEAVIGAVYLDAGLDVCATSIHRWFGDYLRAANPQDAHKDAKTRLQEHLQAQGLNLPKYTTTNVAGPPHEQVFTVECHVETQPAVRAEGKSRRIGEQRAATLMLTQLSTDYP